MNNLIRLHTKFKAPSRVTRKKRDLLKDVLNWYKPVKNDYLGPRIDVSQFDKMTAAQLNAVKMMCAAQYSNGCAITRASIKNDVQS